MCGNWPLTGRFFKQLLSFRGVFRTFSNIYDEVVWKNTEADTQRCSYEKLVRKDAANWLTGEYPSRSAISIKLLRNFIEITLRHWCSPINLLHNCRTPFHKNTSEYLLLKIANNVQLISLKEFIIDVWWCPK